MKLAKWICRSLLTAGLFAVLPLSVAQAQAPAPPAPPGMPAPARGAAAVPNAAPVEAAPTAQPARAALPSVYDTGCFRRRCCYPQMPQCYSCIGLPDHFRYYCTYPWDDDWFNKDWDECFGEECGGNCGQHWALWWIDLHNCKE